MGGGGVAEPLGSTTFTPYQNAGILCTVEKLKEANNQSRRHQL